MNKTITIYELLGLVKDGKAPKTIKYDTKEYIFRNYDYKEVMDALIDEQSSLMECIDFYKFDEPVEIIEGNAKIEKIKWEEKESLAKPLMINDKVEVLAKRTEKLKKKIADLIDHINKIEEKLDERI